MVKSYAKTSPADNEWVCLSYLEEDDMKSMSSSENSDWEHLCISDDDESSVCVTRLSSPSGSNNEESISDRDELNPESGSSTDPCNTTDECETESNVEGSTHEGSVLSRIKNWIDVVLPIDIGDDGPTQYTKAPTDCFLAFTLALLVAYYSRDLLY